MDVLFGCFLGELRRKQAFQLSEKLRGLIKKYEVIF